MAYSSCTTIRTRLVRFGSLSLATGEYTANVKAPEWRTEPCAIPLFSDDERATGRCRSCASGWRCPENYPAEPDPVAELAPDIRARLVDEMGFEPELMGGGCYALRSAARRYYCLVTGADGGLPSAESWQVGLYDGQDDSQTCLWNAVHWTDGPADCREVSPLSLFEAVNACLSIIAEREGH